MNLPHLRATYYDFLDFILTRKGDMWFDGFGPGDQGAYNAFYERSVNLLSEKFNGKTYKPYDKATTIVHFHGPKPQHYVEQLSTQTCSFHTLPSLCETGLAGFCEYAIKDGYFSDAPALQASAERDCKAKFNADAEGASTV